MDVVHPRCCGLDVHKDEVVACVLASAAGGRPRKEVRSFATVTADLLAATREQRLAMPVMHPGRVDVIGAGALILRVLMEEFGLPEVVVSEHDILDGIALRLARG